MNEIPEHILRQQGKITRPEWCHCDDGFWMRNLVDPQCHYHSDYGYELRELLTRAADAMEAYTEYPIGMVMSVTLRESGRSVITELRKAAE